MKKNKKNLKSLFIEDLGQVKGGACGGGFDVTTMALGEEDDNIFTTLAIGEEDGGGGGGDVTTCLLYTSPSPRD